MLSTAEIYDIETYSDNTECLLLQTKLNNNTNIDLVLKI
jgi:hypothetical protein